MILGLIIIIEIKISSKKCFITLCLNSIIVIIKVLLFLNYKDLKMKITLKPWIIAEVVTFIAKLLKENSNANVLEFGSGCSTAFITQYTNNLVTIEDNLKWYQTVQEYVAQNNLVVDLRLVQNGYYKECLKLPKNYFDLILVDGRHRMNCLRYAREIVKPGGILILDDSTYYEKYQEADIIMSDWQCFNAKGLKANPLDISLPEREGTVTWWIKPQ
jgi:predicted O-methyltransferase YrrM